MVPTFSPYVLQLFVSIVGKSPWCSRVKPMNLLKPLHLPRSSCRIDTHHPKTYTLISKHGSYHPSESAASDDYY
jgi:hypothetical protein